MREETTKNRRRISRSERQKRKLFVIGGFAIIVLILLIAIGVFVFGSCGTDYAAVDTNTVFVLKDGSIISSDVEAFEENTYDKEKLESYVQNVIDTYNEANGEDSVKQQTYKVEENVATLVLEYADADVYEDINGVEFFTGSIEEAQKAGYTFEASYAKMKDGKAEPAEVDDFIRGIDYKVVIIKSNTKVVVPGKICFVSSQNVAKVGSDYVLIKDGSQSLAEELDADTEAVTEFGTEAEGSDESISEDDLESGEGDIIFDFGDEPEQEDSQYSEVLTYIIYK
jgi:hypothetical protein